MDQIDENTIIITAADASVVVVVDDVAVVTIAIELIVV